MTERRAVFVGVLASWLVVLAVVLLAYIGHLDRQQAEAARAVLGEQVHEARSDLRPQGQGVR